MAHTNWHALTIESLPGGAYQLKDFRGTILGTDTPSESSSSSREDKERFLSSFLKSSAMDLGLVSEQKFGAVVDFVTNKIAPIIARLVGLSFRRDGTAGDPVSFLCVRHYALNVAIVFEPGDSFGAYLRHCQSNSTQAGLIVGLISPTLGQSSIVDEVLQRKSPVRKKEILTTTATLSRSLSTLPPGMVLKL